MKPGLRGRYPVQSPKSRVDINSIGKVMRIPCSTANFRAASLAPGRKAVTRGEPISTARASAFVNAEPSASGRATASGPMWPPHSRPSKMKRRAPSWRKSGIRLAEGTCRNVGTPPASLRLHVHYHLFEPLDLRRALREQRGADGYAYVAFPAGRESEVARAASPAPIEVLIRAPSMGLARVESR